MHRFFISQIPEGDNISLLDAGQLHHMRDVLRLTTGDEVFVCDDYGNEYTCSIKRMATNGVYLQIKEKNAGRPAGVKVTVACAIPKKGKMDDIIDKLTPDGKIPEGGLLEKAADIFKHKAA